MQLLLNSMMHAAVSVNVASTMSLESFALDIPTINVAFKSSSDFADHGSMWSFDMYHFSEHYHALVDNDAVALARSVDDLVAKTIEALNNPEQRRAAMRKTLRQKSAYCDGTSARRFVDVITRIANKPQEIRQKDWSVSTWPLTPEADSAAGSRPLSVASTIETNPRRTDDLVTGDLTSSASR
jgi:hypothetical protein